MAFREARFLRWSLTMPSQSLSVSQNLMASYPRDELAPVRSDELLVHDPGLWYVLAPLRNAAMAAGVLMANCWPLGFAELNQTNPSSP